MNISLNGLSVDRPIEINTHVSFDESYLKGSGILKLDNVLVNGTVKIDASNEVILNAKIKGIMVLADTNTLDPIDYPFETTITEVIEENNEETEKSLANMQNSLDIMEILWQNIVLEIPIRITNGDVKSKKGNGWELISDNTEKVDPRLAPLAELLEKGKE